jgi:hypothetical protein
MADGSGFNEPVSTGAVVREPRETAVGFSVIANGDGHHCPADAAGLVSEQISTLRSEGRS